MHAKARPRCIPLLLLATAALVIAVSMLLVRPRRSSLERPDSDAFLRWDSGALVVATPRAPITTDWYSAVGAPQGKDQRPTSPFAKARVAPAPTSLLVLVTPGGAYNIVSRREAAAALDAVSGPADVPSGGWPWPERPAVAAVFYRTPPPARGSATADVVSLLTAIDAASDDALAALGLRRNPAVQCSDDAGNAFAARRGLCIGLVGFSAGGHLAGRVATSPKAGPLAFVALSYPVVSMRRPLRHALSARLYLGPDAGDSDAATEASLDTAPPQRWPPTFMWHALDDAAVAVHNSASLFDRLSSQEGADQRVSTAAVESVTRCVGAQSPDASELLGAHLKAVVRSGYDPRSEAAKAAVAEREPSQLALETLCAAVVSTSGATAAEVGRPIRGAPLAFAQQRGATRRVAVSAMAVDHKTAANATLLLLDRGGHASWARAPQEEHSAALWAVFLRRWVATIPAFRAARAFEADEALAAPPVDQSVRERTALRHQRLLAHRPPGA